MKILDTNFIFSLFNPLDSNHSKAKNIIFEIRDEEKIRVPFVVASELCIDKDGGKYLYAVKQITTKFINSSDADLDCIINFPNKIKSQLKANDCLILALCKRLNADLLTFDKTLLRAVKSI